MVTNVRIGIHLIGRYTLNGSQICGLCNINGHKYISPVKLHVAAEYSSCHGYMGCDYT